MSMTPYQWDAQDYANNSGQQQLWGRELWGKLNLQGHESLLDIGCGDGKVTAEIAVHLPAGRVVGVDLSAEMVRLAQERFPQAAHPNLRFEQADASRLPFRAEFDVVFSNAVLHWVIDHRPVLRGINEALKPGGKALLQFGGAGNNAEMMALLAVQTRTPRWAGYFEGFGVPYGFYGVEEYRAWLREAGLTSIRVELIPKDMVHAGREGLAGWVRTTKLPYTQRLPEALREPFINELLDSYLAKFPVDAQGQAHQGMVRLEVEATR
jgi:trans-aconitate 2-methyltransferase